MGKTTVKLPYLNSTDKDVHVGPVTIRPGQTRMVDSMYLVDQVSKCSRASQSSLETEWDLAAYLTKRDKIEKLPTLTDGQLAAVVSHADTSKVSKKWAAAVRFELRQRAQDE